MPPPLPSPQASFTARKAKILQQLAVPDADYTDLSPKGSVDASIRDLIDELNTLEGLVTTSSCGGRVSVFLEGRRDAPAPAPTTDDDVDAADERRTQAGVGGKGGGGTWLFVSHDPVEVPKDDDSAMLRLFGLDAVGDEMPDLTSVRLIHFKFEPMVSPFPPSLPSPSLTTQILHVLTASPSHAQLVLKCALPSGYRESGALNLTPPSSSDPATPMVGVRTMGLTFESLVGYEDPATGRRLAIVPPAMLRNLLAIGNQRFVENAKRIARFRQALGEAMTAAPTRKIGDNGEEWEDAQARKERKRAEGLRRKAEMEAQRAQRRAEEGDVAEEHGVEGIS